MKIKLPLILILLFSMVTSAYTANVPLITAAELKDSLHDPNLTILDVRQAYDWEPSNYKIKGAHRAAPEDFDSWSARYDKSGHYVLYCA